MLATAIPETNSVPLCLAFDSRLVQAKTQMVKNFNLLYKPDSLSKRTTHVR